MAKRCISSIKIDNNDTQLLTISDFSSVTDGNYVSTALYEGNLPAWISLPSEPFVSCPKTQSSSEVSREIENMSEDAILYSPIVPFTAYGYTYTEGLTLLYKSTNLGGIALLNTQNNNAYLGFIVDDDTHDAWFLHANLNKSNNNISLYISHYIANNENYVWQILYGGLPKTGGGAGSGYIGNSLLSNKKMVGYNVPTSSSADTKTESVNDVNASAVSGKPKSGNGFVRITLKSLS